MGKFANSFLNVLLKVFHKGISNSFASSFIIAYNG